MKVFFLTILLVSLLSNYIIHKVFYRCIAVGSLKKIFFVCVFCTFASIGFAQQWVQFSQQANYNLFSNPSLAGSNSTLEAVLAHRSQYVGLSSRAIASQHFAFSTPIFSERLGVGVSFINDFIGFQQYSSTQLTGAYHIPLRKMKLGIGVGLGFVQMGLDGAKLRAADGNYNGGQVVHNDGSLPAEKVGGVNFSGTTGISLYSNRFSAGVAIQNMLSPKIGLSNTNNETFIFINRTINLHGSYVIRVNKVNMLPSVFFKSDFVKHQMQINFKLEMGNINIGAAFRGYSGLNNDAIVTMFGFKVKKNFEVNYSYDFVVSGLNNVNSGTHELSLKYRLPINFDEKSRGNILYTPRFL